MFNKIDDLLATTAGVFDFEYYSYLVLKNKDVQYCKSTYHEAWVEHYKENKYYLSDPALLPPETPNLGQVWGFRMHKNLSNDSQDVLEGAYDFKIRSGITIPYSSQEGESYITFASRKDLRKTERKFLLIEGLLFSHVIGFCTHILNNRPIRDFSPPFLLRYLNNVYDLLEICYSETRHNLPMALRENLQLMIEEVLDQLSDLRLRNQ